LWGGGDLPHGGNLSLYLRLNASGRQRVYFSSETKLNHASTQMPRYKYKNLASAACALLLLLNSRVHAEEDDIGNRRRVTLGGTVGASIATEQTESPLGNNLDAGNKIGLVVGAVATIQIYPSSMDTSALSLSVQPEILLVAKGTNIDRDGETLGADHLRYLEIPLLAQTRFRITSTLSPYFLLGPELAVLLTAELENSRGEITDTKENFKMIDFGLVFGGGMAIDIASLKGTLNLEARYDLGLTDINDTGMGGFVKNRAVFVMLGYQYGAL
jgi:hypothetical protein